MHVIDKVPGHVAIAFTLLYMHQILVVVDLLAVGAWQRRRGDGFRVVTIFTCVRY